MDNWHLLQWFSDNNISLAGLLLYLIHEERARTHFQHLYTSFLDVLPAILDYAHNGDHISAWLEDWHRANENVEICQGKLKQTYIGELLGLVAPDAGYHFSAQRSHPEQLLEFSIQNLSNDITKRAPYLWDLLGCLLNPDQQQERRETLTQEPSLTESMLSQDPSLIDGAEESGENSTNDPHSELEVDAIKRIVSTYITIDDNKSN